MKVCDLPINIIKEDFSKINSLNSFLILLNKIKMYYDDNENDISASEFSYYTNPSNTASSYITFYIPKKRGGSRLIHRPVSRLKIIHTCISKLLQVIYEPHCSATGFIENLSIRDNAKKHVSKNYVFNLDLKDFFHSIKKDRLINVLKSKPFYLANKNRQQLATMIASICFASLTFDKANNGKKIVIKKNILPQGAPTSPVISNIVLFNLDKRLDRLAKLNNCSYTRYADDITFSSMHNIYELDGVFYNKIKHIIENEGFIINKNKVRLLRKGIRQEVTGITVNEKTNVKREYKKSIRMWLYYWEKYGYSKTVQIYSNKNNISEHINFSRILKGKIEFIGTICGKNSDIYLSLLQRYNKLAIFLHQ